MANAASTSHYPAAPAAALALRSKYFGLTGAGSAVGLGALNEQLWCLA